MTRATALLAKARAWFSALSRPARILFVTTIAVASAIALYFGYAQSHETYAPLFSQLESEDAAAVVAKLKEQKTPYKLSEHGGTSTIEVPEASVHETRLALAGSGLPRGGGVGFESFDKLHLGATEFEQRVLYRRALEGELARTIGTIATVETARVHLVLPEKSVFVSRAEPTSGTIVLKLRAGRGLSPSDVGAIVHLTASSVPGLQPERITLVTTDGAMLHKPRKTGDDASADPDALSDRHAMESAVEDRVRTMLERVVGIGHADVRVSADVDAARVEHVEDHYDPTKSALRSMDETLERSSADNSVTGVPGAESNTPQGSASGSTAALAPNMVRESHTRNFEIDHISDKRVQAGGALRRLTVAVVLDGIHSPSGANIPRGREDIDRLSLLVASAAGADAKRGDVVTVESVPFFDEPVLASPAASSPSLAPSKPPMKWLIGAAAAVFVLAVLGALVIRSRRRTSAVVEQPSAAQLSPAPEVRELQAGKLDARAEAMALAAKDPATAALILRAWLGGNQVAHADRT